MIDNSCKPKHNLRTCPAMRALEDLTPGGSEFIDDISRCVETVRHAQRQRMDLLVEAKRRQHLADTELAKFGIAWNGAEYVAIP